MTQYQHQTKTGLLAVVQVKRTRPKVDESALEQLLYEKGLLKECTKTVIDHDLVEQLYIEERLTDNDLREINGGSKVQLALSVDKVDADV